VVAYRVTPSPKKKAGDVAQVVDCLPGKCRALSSKLSKTHTPGIFQKEKQISSFS
jgi:hypothetical protein